MQKSAGRILQEKKAKITKPKNITLLLPAFIFLFSRSSDVYIFQKKESVMKITHVISDTNVGGAGVLLTSILGNLGEDFEFEAILPKNSKLSSLIPKNIRLTELNVSGDKSFSAADVKTFYNYFKLNTPDIIHTHASLSARLGAKLAGVKTALSTRHCAKVSDRIIKQGPLKRMLYSLSTDITVSTADFATQNLIKEGVPCSRIITIKNGSADVSRLIENSSFSTHRELGIPENKKIVGSCARLEKIKGQDVLLRAVPRVLKEYKDVHFVFIGTGSLLDEYKRLSASLGVEKFVTFTGYTDKPWLYQKDFYINVNSSRGTETSCLSTSECMALSIPTVASDFGGNTEMIKHGENGYIFPSDNPFELSELIIKLLKDENIRENFARSAREYYDKFFSAQRMAEDYKRLYRSLEFAKSQNV